MKRIWVTGGIGSGKTEFCRKLEALGAHVVHADDLAKSLMTEDAGLKEAIVAAFGPAAYRPDGSLDRAHLAAEAFGKGRVEELNALVHPAVGRAMRRLAHEAAASGAPLFVYEAALLPSGAKPDGFDAVVLVVAPEADRVARVSARDTVGEGAVRQRMARQWDEARYRAAADLVVPNSGSLDALRNEAEKRFQEWTASR